MTKLRASKEADRRLLEDTIQALRAKLEVATADTAQNLENIRASHEANRRESEGNIQAIRENMEQLRN